MFDNIEAGDTVEVIDKPYDEIYDNHMMRVGYQYIVQEVDTKNPFKYCLKDYDFDLQEWYYQFLADDEIKLIKKKGCLKNLFFQLFKRR